MFFDYISTGYVILLPVLFIGLFERLVTQVTNNNRSDTAHSPRTAKIKIHIVIAKIYVLIHNDHIPISQETSVRNSVRELLIILES